MAAALAEQYVDGLWRDKARKPREVPLPKNRGEGAGAAVFPPPGNATLDQTNLRAEQRDAHRSRTFKKSNDPVFAEKSRMWLASTWRRRTITFPKV